MSSHRFGVAAIACGLLLGAVSCGGRGRAGAGVNGGAQKADMKGDGEIYGKTPGGDEIRVYTLNSKNGLKAKLINWGAILTELHVPDRNGKLADVVLGFDALAGWLKNPAYFGCTTGRVANRIAGGKFTLDGKEYQLAANNGPNHLHGGVRGLDKRVWKAALSRGADAQSVRFTYQSPEEEENYPGNLDLTVVYTLNDQDELRIDYEAETDAPTPVNLTNHSYFNLAGEGQGTILDHQLLILADHYTPVDAASIPTGDIALVRGTPLDFTQLASIGARIDELKGNPGGYDHNFVLRGQTGVLALAARVRDPKSGRTMEISTTEPGLQLYTANYLDGSIQGKGGKTYRKHFGLCLETQHYPDSVNRPQFPSVILRPGKSYRSTTVHRFSAR